MTYHLFIIKKEVYELYKNKTYSLYKLLFNLYSLNRDDLVYGVTLYNQLCDIINIKKMNEYFSLLNGVRVDDNKYCIIDNNIKHLIILKPSHIIYKTDCISDDILYLLGNYSKYIFFCNFMENDFYFIEK